MQILNLYFSPFAAILIIFAIYFSDIEKPAMFISAGILAAVTLLNYWIAKQAYRFLQWTNTIRIVILWLNLAASIMLFYMLGSYWAPMWLLFLTAPATAAMFMSRLRTLAVAFAAAASMLGIYLLKGVEGAVFWGQASVHAIFVIIFSLFVHALAQMALRIRDSTR